MFAAIQYAHRAAYGRMDVLAEQGQEFDPATGVWAPGCNAESAAMNEFLAMPAHTPAEVGAKLAYMRDRDINDNWTEYVGWMAQIERDLIELQRPCVSPTMRDHFQEWRNDYAAYDADCDDESKSRRHSETFLAMMAVSCASAGDLIVKVYANQLLEHGGTWLGAGRSDNPLGAYMFELDTARLMEGMGDHDGAAEVAFARDIRHSDLGRCLLALGRIDFDAQAWVAAVRRAQLPFTVVIQPNGHRTLLTGERPGLVDDRHVERFDVCQGLIAGGLGTLGAERRAAVCAWVEENEPAMVIDVRDQLGDPA